MHELSRVLMTISCSDSDNIPKTTDAGRILFENGELVQVMHNGLRVLAGGYHGDWMAHIIRSLRGHHEPQEERVFHHLLRYIRHNSVMVELGSYWAYYSLWFLSEIPGSRALCVEPDPAHMAVGVKNAALNGMSGRIDFLDGWIGADAAPSITQRCETTQELRALECFDFPRLLELIGNQNIEVLHLDIQGTETAFLSSMVDVTSSGKVRFVVVSTHHSSISGSRTTHMDCLRTILDLGGNVLVEHDIQASFSGDGLIVASFYPQDRALTMPQISRNAPHQSLFPSP